PAPDRWGARLGDCGRTPVLYAVARRNAETRVECRSSASDELRRAVAGSARQRAVQEQLPTRLGAVSLPRRAGRSATLDNSGRRQGRAADRALLSKRP